MKCENCPALYVRHYAESYETDEECLAGISEDDLFEDKDGNVGCRLHLKTILKRKKANDEAFEAECERYVEWFLEQEKKKS